MTEKPLNHYSPSYLSSGKDSYAHDRFSLLLVFGLTVRNQFPGLYNNEDISYPNIQRPAYPFYLSPLNKIVDEKIDNFYEESLKLKSNWKLLLKISAITFVQLAVYYIIPYFILLSLGVTHVNVIMVISMHVLIVMVVSLFPIPGGAGGAEYSFSVIFSSFIGTGSKLVLAMLLWRIVTYYFGMLSGLIAMLIQPKRIVTKK